MFGSSITVAFIGQIILAAAQPIIISCPGKLATIWFREEKVF